MTKKAMMLGASVLIAGAILLMTFPAADAVGVSDCNVSTKHTENDDGSTVDETSENCTYKVEAGLGGASACLLSKDSTKVTKDAEGNVIDEQSNHQGKCNSVP